MTAGTARLRPSGPGPGAPVPGPGPGRHRRLHTVLPRPPASAEMYIYSDRDRLYLASLEFINFASKTAGQIFLEVHVLWGFVIAPLTAIFIVYELINFWTNLPGPGFDFTAHAERVANWRPRRWPTVDIFLPVCGEPLLVLQNTWEALSIAIRDYPGVVRAYVLNDGSDPDLDLLAAEYGLEYIRRPRPGEHKKAGNLRWAFNHTVGEYIAVLDADFAPSRRFLRETLPYLDDPRVGIVQTPQFFRTEARQTWVERAGCCAQEIFYRLIQVSRDRYDSALCVGTNAVYRRAALAPNGGFTLIGHSEDAHTGLDTQLRGYKIRYIPVVLATGMCPTRLSSFIHQQYRWCNGTMSIIFARRMWSLPISLRARRTYINGLLWNVWTVAEVVLGPLIPIAVLVFDPSLVRLNYFLVIVPALLAGMLNFPLWHKAGYGPSTWPITIATGWAQAMSMIDYAGGRVMSWQPTGARTNSLSRFRLGLGWNSLQAATWLGLAMWRYYQTRGDGFMVAALFAAMYAAMLTCVLFTDWRDS
jgi:cellulose synthase (UDP-forming)